MKCKKKWLSVLLTAVLLTALLPSNALAAGQEAEWAKDAADTLNAICGEEAFSADTAAMTEATAAETVKKAGWATDISLDDGEIPLTRGKACEVLSDVFALPVPDNMTAIQYLYQQNIVNGRAAGDLAENNPVTCAEFAVLAFRVLNSVGGGEGTEEGWLAPGSKGYTAWMYLAVRRCVPFETEQVDTAIGEVEGLETYVESVRNADEDRSTISGETTLLYTVNTVPKSGEEIWEAWENALQDQNIGGSESFAAPAYQESDTLLEAAVRMMDSFEEHKADAVPVIFHDVTAGNWFYDGIMYLVNNNIVIGYGDGKFGPDDITPRYELAVLLTNVEGVTLTTDPGPGRIIEAIEYVTEKGYMNGNVPETSDENPWNPKNDTYWGEPATREEAAVGILRMIENKENIDTSSDNLAILNRFTDAEYIQNENSKPYLAYAVSMGLLSGTGEKTLKPDSEVSRAQTGVLLYRTLIGLDTSKMHDYEENVQNVLEIGNSSDDAGTAA